MSTHQHGSALTIYGHGLRSRSTYDHDLRSGSAAHNHTHIHIMYVFLLIRLISVGLVQAHLDNITNLLELICRKNSTKRKFKKISVMFTDYY